MENAVRKRKLAIEQKREECCDTGIRKRAKQMSKKGKAIPVTGSEGLQGSEMLRIPHCLDNRLIVGGKAVSSTHRPHFTLHKHFFNVSSTHFC
jgi:hypothetical protein